MSPMTHKLLLETLRWDEDTQAFYYLVRRGCRPAGSVAGTTTKEGYRQITLYGHLFSIQRLLFYFKNGYIPTTPVLSGRPRRNTAPRGKLKIKGVTPVRSGAKVRYIAQSKGRYIGCYATKEDAELAYLQHVASLTSDNNNKDTTKHGN